MPRPWEKTGEDHWDDLHNWAAWVERNIAEHVQDEWRALFESTGTIPHNLYALFCQCCDPSNEASPCT